MTSQTATGAPVHLSNATLADLPESFAVPRYDREGLTPGIVHIGLGNFHRAHQAWYLHRLMQDGRAHDWAILGAGVRPGDAVMREKLLNQDCLTTLVELDPERGAVEVTGAMIGFLPVEAENAPLIAQLSDPAIRIVSLTVTEGGYYLDADGAFDAAHPDIRHDAAHPDTPRTAFGAIVAALRARRAAGVAPFTALSCDNLQGNGSILRNCVLGLAGLTDPDLARWIDEEGSFPNSMVDCIVPATTPELIEKVRGLGIDDAAPVSHESFRQWVIEDRFVAGRPEWEHVGATLTDDVHSYETMKLRILNGGHQLLANAGELLSLQTIADCMADAEVRAFFHKVEQDEILPFVSAVPSITPESYLELIERRFSNPMIRDTTRRVAFDGSSRHPGFLLPSARDGRAAGRSIEGLALSQALWARMCAGVREDGSAIEANDPNWDERNAAALEAKTTPEAWLVASIYGSLARDAVFTERFAFWLQRLWADGTRATLQGYLESGT